VSDDGAILLLLLLLLLLGGEGTTSCIAQHGTARRSTYNNSQV
jgi:hypothetical protein